VSPKSQLTGVTIDDGLSTWNVTICPTFGFVGLTEKVGTFGTQPPPVGGSVGSPDGGGVGSSVGSGVGGGVDVGVGQGLHVVQTMWPVGVSHCTLPHLVWQTVWHEG
jgi:hypothetical protein